MGRKVGAGPRACPNQASNQTGQPQGVAPTGLVNDWRFLKQVALAEQSEIKENLTSSRLYKMLISCLIVKNEVKKMLNGRFRGFLRGKGAFSPYHLKNDIKKTV